jgi:N-acetylneuraminic acid mutarotase
MTQKSLSAETLVRVFALMLGLLLISSSDQLFAQGGVWVTKTPMPTARSHVMAAGITGKFYVVGGQIGCCDDEDVLDTLEVYNPATNTWATQAPMHQARSAGRSAVIGDKWYVVGGRTGGEDPHDVATLEVYNPMTDTWTTKTPMPTPRRWQAVEAIGGLLYVAGGEESPGPGVLATLEVYDPPAIAGRQKPPYLHRDRRWRPA